MIFYNINVLKSIQYFTKCIENKGEKIIFERKGFYEITFNFMYYPANNELGLIYILFDMYRNLELAKKFLFESMTCDYPIGRNNYGLLCEFYFDYSHVSKDCYEKASTGKFSLAEFNLGRLIEKKDGFINAMKYYKNASKHENHVIIYHQNEINIEQLRISKAFIACLAYLKLVHFFLSNNNLNKA